VLLVLEFGVDVESPVPELLVVVVEAEEDEVEVVETPIVATIATRLFIAQQASDVRSPPQHQLPSVKHWDTAAVPFADPPVCVNCQLLLNFLP
jgi:hypothetical protein